MAKCTYCGRKLYNGECLWAEKILEHHEKIARILERNMRACSYDCDNDCPSECFDSKIWDFIFSLYVRSDRITKTKSFGHFRRIEIKGE